MPNREREVLESLLKEVSSEGFSANIGIKHKHKSRLSVITENACEGKQKAVLAVITTLLLKKVLSPDQDIRQHRADLPDGFSGRGLDTRSVTPFLRDENFPYMQSGSGWLTRSLEQAHPYDMNYPGNIKPKILKDSFLKTLDAVQKGTDAGDCLRYLFCELARWREKNASISLAKPTGKRIEEIVSLVGQHWQDDLPGSARLPVLAIYAVYRCLVSEVAKYRDCHLLGLLSHTSADSKTSRVGDIDIQKDSKTIESVEVKHNIAITSSLLEQLRGKIAGSGLKTFYLLSTDEIISPKEMPNITELLLAMRQNYGCQIIVNGVACTIRYYLRLLSDTDSFVHEYVTLVEADMEIPFSLKERWNEIIG